MLVLRRRRPGQGRGRRGARPRSPPPGQLCISVERLYVHESVADDFLERFVARTRAMRLGVGARLRRRHGLARLRAAAGERHPARRGGPRQGRHRADRRPAPPGHRPAVLRADRAGRRRGADGRLRGGDLRPSRLRLPLPRRGRGRRAAPTPRPTASTRACGAATAAAPARSPPGCAPAPSTSTRATPPPTAASSRPWAAWATPGSAGGTAPRASSSTPRRRPSPTSGCCPWRRRSAWATRRYAAFMTRSLKALKALRFR